MKNIDCYSIYFKRLSQLITNKYDLAFKDLGITTNQYSIIKTLEQLEPASISELAKALGLDRTTLTRNLKPLISNHLIEDLSPNSRARQLELTSSGREILSQARPIWGKLQQSMEDSLGKEKLESVKKTFENL